MPDTDPTTLSTDEFVARLKDDTAFNQTMNDHIHEELGHFIRLNIDEDEHVPDDVTKEVANAISRGYYNELDNLVTE